MLRVVAESLIAQVKHENPDLKKACLEGLETIIKGNLSMVNDLLGDIEQFALQESKVRPELIIEVDLGPFKQKQDNGLHMCKAAFNLLDTLYSLTDSIDRSKMVDSVIAGLKDPDESKIVLCINLLIKVCHRSCNDVLVKMEPLVAALELLFKNSLKLVTKQDRSLNIVRAVLRLCYAIKHSPELAEQPLPRFNDFFNT